MYYLLLIHLNLGHFLTLPELDKNLDHYGGKMEQTSLLYDL